MNKQIEKKIVNNQRNEKNENIEILKENLTSTQSVYTINFIEAQTREE